MLWWGKAHTANSPVSCCLKSCLFIRRMGGCVQLSDNAKLTLYGFGLGTRLLCIKPCSNLIRIRYLAAHLKWITSLSQSAVYVEYYYSNTIIIAVHVLLQPVHCCFLDVWLVGSDVNILSQKSPILFCFWQHRGYLRSKVKTNKNVFTLTLYTYKYYHIDLVLYFKINVVLCVTGGIRNGNALILYISTHFTS